MRLLRERELTPSEPAFEAARHQVPGHYDQALLDEPAAGRSLRFFLLLTHFPELLTHEQPTAEELFWSGYYWLARYVELQLTLHGPDAGLEQQLAEVLETPYPTCNPDWSHLESVEAQAAKDAAAQLR
jgi:hypothetical protein